MLKITIKKDYRTLKIGDTFSFNKGINLIVGQNGSGKSSLLNLLRSELIINKRLNTRHTYQKHHEKDYKEICSIEGISEFDNFYDFDTEVDSGKGLAMSDMNIFLQSDGLKVGRTSSGEGQLYQTQKLLNNISKTTNNLILIDELDKGWSISNQELYFNLLNKYLKNNDILILISHNTALLNHVDNVLDMTTKTVKEPYQYYISLDQYKLNIIKHLVKLVNIDKEFNDLFKIICVTDFDYKTYYIYYNKLLSTLLNHKKYKEHLDTTFKPLIDFLLKYDITHVQAQGV